MYLYRIHVKPQGGTADVRTIFDYCLSNDLLGVGWQTKTNTNTKSWDEYFSEASQIHSNLDSCKYIQKWVREGDLVWTRDGEANYYIARVNSGWEYWRSQEAAERDIDIANIFRCTLHKVKPDAVPGKVVACFRSPRSIQAIADNKAVEYSKYLWNKLSKSTVYDVDKSKFSDIFMMLDDEETEDLVFLYLQSLGWYVVPNSRKADTMSFEFLLVNPQTDERASTQVKTGKVVLNTDDYEHYPLKVFLFQSSGQYEGSNHDNVIRIPRTDLLDFLEHSKTWLPESFRNKLEVVKQ